jgi:hypothetical protein
LELDFALALGIVLFEEDLVTFEVGLDVGVDLVVVCAVLVLAMVVDERRVKSRELQVFEGRGTNATAQSSSARVGRVGRGAAEETARQWWVVQVKEVVERKAIGIVLSECIRAQNACFGSDNGRVKYGWTHRHSENASRKRVQRC